MRGDRFAVVREIGSVCELCLSFVDDLGLYILCSSSFDLFSYESVFDELPTRVSERGEDLAIRVHVLVSSYCWFYLTD